VIAQRRWRDGKFELTFLSEKVDGLFYNLGVERRFVFESGKQFAHGAGIKQRSGKAMLANFARFFEHIDIFFAELRIRVRGIVCVDELR